MTVEPSSAAPMTRPDAEEQPVVVLDKVSLAFDDKVVLREVSFTLLPGHTKVILGASGSGKSTILKLILGLLKPDGGTIFVNGERIETARLAPGDRLKVGRIELIAMKEVE